MKCACIDSGPSYERLSPLATDTGQASPFISGFGGMGGPVLELRGRISPDNNKDSNNEKQEELSFYSDDGSLQRVVVERDLRAQDLCRLLARRYRLATDPHHVIYEHWVDLELERPLEDHEDVLRAHRDMESYSRRAERRFVFRKDPRKYEYFRDPLNYYPADMLNHGSSEDLGGSDALGIKTLMDTECLISSCESSQFVGGPIVPPVLCSHVWVRGPNRQVWAKAFLILRNGTLYLAQRAQLVARILRGPVPKSGGSPLADYAYGGFGGKEDNQLQPFARLSDFHVYATLNAKNHFRAPTEFGLVLRPLGDPPAPTSGGDCGGEVGVGEPGLRCIACDSERERTCWMTAMRLAKYGKQLRENYRSFKNKGDPLPVKDYNSYTVPSESIRSRVAMDFTGAVGRIVDDPQEARAIADAEGYSWKRRWRPTTRCQQAPPPMRSTPPATPVAAGVHVGQPWFHSGMSRDQAAALVARHGNVDGVFLVRESRSSPVQNHFVLTYRCGRKVLHAHIQPLPDPSRDSQTGQAGPRGGFVYSLDGGVTKFYDLLQLVEFYQLNAGSLPTRLTHYVVHQISVIGNNASAPTSSANSPALQVSSNSVQQEHKANMCLFF